MLLDILQTLATIGAVAREGHVGSLVHIGRPGPPSRLMAIRSPRLLLLALRDAGFSAKRGRLTLAFPLRLKQLLFQYSNAGLQPLVVVRELTIFRGQSFVLPGTPRRFLRESPKKTADFNQFLERTIKTVERGQALLMGPNEVANEVRALKCSEPFAELTVFL